MEIAREMTDLVTAHRTTPDGMVFYDSIDLYPPSDLKAKVGYWDS